jgi:hypothetical protein
MIGSIAILQNDFGPSLTRSGRFSTWWGMGEVTIYQYQILDPKMVECRLSRRRVNRQRLAAHASRLRR